MRDSEILITEISSVFDHDLSGEEAATHLTRMRQGNESVVTFSITFRSLAGETGRPQAPLMTLFRNALSDPVRDALASYMAIGHPLEKC